MILADPRGRATATRIGGRITLDELLRRAALRRPDALAVLDPPNREAVVGGKPRSLTYKQAEHVVSAIAGRLRRMGLHTASSQCLCRLYGGARRWLLRSAA